MLPKHYTRIVLAERPKTNITPTTFRKETVAFDLKPGPGEVLVRVDWLSLDPAMRGWIKEVASFALVTSYLALQVRLESFWTLCCDRDLFFYYLRGRGRTITT
jgi:N-terminal domain of oxidoreductase